MTKIFNIDDKRTTYDKVSSAIDSDNFVTIYYTETGALGIIQGNETTVADMAMFKALVDYISAVSIENMYMNGEEGE